MARGLGTPFWLLYCGESTSAIGTTASAVALPITALRITGDVRQAGLAGTAVAVGVVAARLPGGVIADRRPARGLLLVANLLGAVVLGTVALLLQRNAVSVPVLLTAGLLLGTIPSFLAPVENVALRTFVQRNLLPRALALIQTRMAAATVAGPLAGGALLAVAPAWVFTADACTYLAACVCMALLPRRDRPQATAEHPLRSAAEGIRFVWRSPFLRYAAVNATVLNLVFNGLLILVVAAAGTHGGSIGVGVQMAALGGGALAGSAVAVPVARRLPPARGIAAATALVAAVLLGFSGARTEWLAAGLLALAAATGPVVTVVVTTLQMAITPPELQGRVHSGIGFLAQAVAPVGPLLAGLSAHALGFTPTVVCAAFAVAAVALVGGIVVGRQAPGPPTPSDSPLRSGRG